MSVCELFEGGSRCIGNVVGVGYRGLNLERYIVC